MARLLQTQRLIGTNNITQTCLLLLSTDSLFCALYFSFLQMNQCFTFNRDEQKDREVFITFPIYTHRANN